MFETLILGKLHLNYDFVVNTSEGDLKIKSVDKCEGEACANNRKGKLIFFYEWDIILNWEGKLKEGTDRTHSGSIKVPNLSEENDMSDLDVSMRFTL